jgi:hypothetical protein
VSGEVHVVPILHPAYIIRGNWKHDPAQAAILRMAKELARGNFEPLDINKPPPGSNLDPSPTYLEGWLKGVTRDGVSCDVEAAGPHLVCIGFCRLSDFTTVVVRFRRKGGAPWDPDWDTLRAKVIWVDRILGDPNIPKVFQNGQAFDIPLLEEIGFTVRGYNADTLVMAKTAYPEMPGGLEYLAVSYARIPGWKHLVRDSEEADK